METVAADYKVLLGSGIPVYTDPKRCANALAKFAAYAKFRSNKKA
jgi:acyl-CoA synthetase (NDP forming)